MTPTLILDNIRSAHNVGSILRTADAAGIKSVWLCGITPTPGLSDDPRPAYVQERNRRLLAKTALGAEVSLELYYTEQTIDSIKAAKLLGYRVIGLEQTKQAKDLFAYHPLKSWALVVGHEVQGVKTDVLEACDDVIEIPMRGAKESLNVSVATGIALYQLMQA